MISLLVVLAMFAAAGFVTWALLWPRPTLAHRASCPHYLSRCEVIGGRVLYHTAFGRGRRAHIVLISSRSVTLPGVVSAEFPEGMRRYPSGFSIGDWVSIAGDPMRGSHGETDIHMTSFATSSASIRCGPYRNQQICRAASRWPTWW